MRFQFSVIASVALASIALAQPIQIQSRASEGLLQKVGELVSALEKGLGVTAVEDALDKALDGKLTDVEDSLGSTKAEEGLGLLSSETDDGTLQAVGKLIKTLEDDLGVTAVEDALDKALGGSVTKLEDALGLTQAEKGLGLA